MEINQFKQVKVNAKEVQLYMKVRDEFSCSIVDQDKKNIHSYEGYVPSFMPGEHYGDYLILNIDLDTGQVTNWKTPTPEEIEQFIKGEED